MSSIDEVSKTLGSLQSDMDHVRRTTEAIHLTMKETNDKVVVQDQKIEAAHSRLDNMEPALDVVAEHEAIKNKGVGFFIGLSTFFGAVGSVATNFIIKALL